MATSEEEYEPQYPTDSDEIYVLEHYDDQPQSSLSSSSSLLQLFDNLDGVEEEDEREPQLGEDYDQDDDNEMLLEGFGDTDDLVFGFNYDITLLHDDNEYYITSFKDSPEEILHDIDAPCHDDDEKDISFGDNKETSFGCGRQRSKIDDDDDVDDVNDEKGTIAGKTRKTLFKKRKFSAVCDDNDEDVDHDADADDDDGDKKDVTLQEKKQGLYRRSKITVVRDFPFGCGRPMTKTSDDDDVGHDVDVNFDDDDDGDGDGDDKDVTRQENKQGMYKRRKITVVRDFPFGCGRSMTKTSDDHDVDHDDDVNFDDDDDDGDGDGDGDEKDVTRQENKQGLYKRRKITVVRDFPFGCGRPVIDKKDSVTAIQKNSTEEEGEGRRIVLALAAPSICPWRDTNGGLKKGRFRVHHLN